MTPQQLARSTGASISIATAWLVPVVAAMERFDINTRSRQAYFVSQISVECRHFTALREDLDYSVEALLAQWPTHFTQETAEQYGRTGTQKANQVMIANLAYGGRFGNGDAASGDGWKFRGGGCIGTTFRDNYRSAGIALGLPLEEHPEQIVQPAVAALTAGLYWMQHNCNERADAHDIIGITRAINGGLNGLQARTALYAQAMGALA